MSLTPKTNPSPYPLPRHFKVCEHGEKEQPKEQEDDNPYHDTQTAAKHISAPVRAPLAQITNAGSLFSTLVVVVEDFFPLSRGTDFTRLFKVSHVTSTLIEPHRCFD